jgi:hypothetical protein
MKLLLAVFLLMSLAKPALSAAEAPMTAVTAAPDSISPTAATPSAAPGEAHGFLYAFSFAQWNVFNGAPLSYTPLEVGWAFENGFRLQSGIDLFYYEGVQDNLDAPPVPERYTFEMMDWRSTLLYRMPLKFRLRPLAGITLEAVRGTRKPLPYFVGSIDINANAHPIEAWGFLGMGGLLGMEWLFNRDWSWCLSARTLFPFGSAPGPLVIQTGFNVVL